MVPIVALLSLAGLAAAETFFVAETNASATWAWENATTWRIADGSSPGVLPGRNDDVVFVPSQCFVSVVPAQGTTLMLQSDVTVRSVTVGSLGLCLTSFFVGQTGWLRAQRVTAVTEARVFLDNGKISAPSVTLDFSYLGGAGTISGEVNMTGGSTLFAGEPISTLCGARGLTFSSQERSRSATDAGRAWFRLTMARCKLTR
jgi:hypothetical protein